MLVAVVLVLRLRHGMSSRRRLLSMGAAAHHPSRCLVEVLRPLRTIRTGQLLLVIDARTGQEAMVWLPLSPRLKSGDLGLLVWMSDRWLLMDWHPARRSLSPSVFARPHCAISMRTRGLPGPLPQDDDVVREVERYLGE